MVVELIVRVGLDDRDGGRLYELFRTGHCAVVSVGVAEGVPGDETGGLRLTGELRSLARLRGLERNSNG